MDLVRTLAAHRQHLVGAYKSPHWSRVAAEYGAVAGDRRGQLEHALNAVVHWARQLTDDAAITTHLDDFVDEALREAAPRTGSSAGLAGIFANATANTGWWAAKYSDESTIIASCRACGAPQQRVLHFQCEHCDQPLYPQHPESP